MWRKKNGSSNGGASPSRAYKHMGDAIYSSGIVSTSQHMEKQQSISTYSLTTKEEAIYTT